MLTIVVIFTERCFGGERSRRVGVRTIFRIAVLVSFLAVVAGGLFVGQRVVREVWGDRVELDIPETLGSVYRMPVEDQKRCLKFWARANPEAKPYLYKILEDASQTAYHRNVWLILGYIGDDNDVRLLERNIVLDIRTKFPDLDEDVCILFEALGLFCSRGSRPALALADRMQQFSYWRDEVFQWSDTELRRVDSRRFLPLSYFTIGYIFSLNEDIEERVSIVAAERGRDPAKYLDDNLKTMLRNARRLRGYETERITAGERRHLASLFNGDLENPGRRGVLSPASARKPSTEDEGKLFTQYFLDRDVRAVPIYRERLRLVLKDGPVGWMRSWAGDSIQAAAVFGDTATLPALRQFLTHESFDDSVKQIAADAIARIGAREDIDLLKDMMKDENLYYRTRCFAAESLVKLGHQEAGGFLLSGYERFREEFRSWPHSESAEPATPQKQFEWTRDSLARLDVPELIEAVEQHVQAEPAGVPRRNVEDLVDAMRKNRRDLEQLREVASNPTARASDAERRGAIHLLGRKGTVEDIALVKSLKPWAESSATEAPENSLNSRAVNSALKELRRRHWMQMYPDVAKLKFEWPHSP